MLPKIDYSSGIVLLLYYFRLKEEGFTIGRLCWPFYWYYFTVSKVFYRFVVFCFAFFDLVKAGLLSSFKFKSGIFPRFCKLCLLLTITLLCCPIILESCPFSKGNICIKGMSPSSIKFDFDCPALLLFKEIPFCLL
jgi:hypothetical protein